MSDKKIIAVVDDDESVRESLPDLLESFGFGVRTYASADAFLTSGDADPLGCMILDVAMPGMSGPQLQQELIRQNRNVPIVFITAHSDDGAWPTLLNSGAVACLVKPFSESAIVEAVRMALEREP